MIKSLQVFFLILFIFISTTTSYSQQNLLKKANEQYEKYEYINAQKSFLKIIDKGHSSVDILKKLGNSYYFNSQYKEASVWYKQLFTNNKEELEPEYFYRYSQTLKSLGDYSESNLYMKSFCSLKPYDKRAMLFLKNQDYLNKTKGEFEKYQITNLSMNSNITDFGTAFYGDEIIFSSSRETNDIHEWNKESYLDFYVAEYEKNSRELYNVKKWGNIFNSNYHESTPVFTKDKKTVYFTRNNEDESRYQKLNSSVKIRTDRLKIYRSTKNEKGEWSEPKPLPFNNDDYSAAHPALSIDEKKLYFSSDMPGGIGESDLYEIEIKKNGSFGKPKNLGQQINTEGKETFPFISSSNNLYFSSDGHVGIGGLDVFVINDLNNKQSLQINNIGKPINSPQDDFTFIIDEETKSGFFSSNRSNGKGKDDIYSFIESKPQKQKAPLVLNPEKGPEEPIVMIEEGDDLNRVLELNPIYFDLDKSFIRQDAAIELDKVVDVMLKNPTIKIKIRSHTDSRAIWYYNTALSKRRAKSTRLYLIKNGINSNRIKAWGYGESELLNHCSDGVKCNEEEHQLNRRSEFIVTEY